MIRISRVEEKNKIREVSIEDREKVQKNKDNVQSIGKRKNWKYQNEEKKEEKL